MRYSSYCGMSSSISQFIQVSVPVFQQRDEKGYITTILGFHTSMLCQKVITGATGTVSQGLKKISRNNTRTTLNRFPTKTAILGTSQNIRKVLQSET
jgi:hypothetical protein